MRLFTSMVLVFAVDTYASQPGQPLDCQDWVFLDPIYSCQEFVSACSSVGGGSPQCIFSGEARALTNDSRTLRLTSVLRRDACGMGDLTRWQLEEFSGDSSRVIAYLDERCLDAINLWKDQAGAYPCVPIAGESSGGIRFDPMRGSLLFSMALSESCSVPTGGCADRHAQVIAFEFAGFTTLFEVVQSYKPTQDQVGFVVPHHPHGLRAADRFDSYWGVVTQPLDLAHAHPLQCGYPPNPPAAGEYLQIANAVPTPQSGAANYVLTASSYQGETRVGRKRTASGSVGRDASRLPACVISDR